MLTREEMSAVYDALRLETPRLLVRKNAALDRPVLHRQEEDREIMRYIRDPLPPEVLDRRLEEQFAPWTAEPGIWMCQSVLIREPEETLIGILSLKVDDYERETVEIGYRFDPRHHGSGYATEAARALCDHLFARAGVHRITAFCVAENEPSFRLMERLGMRREACFRAYSRLGGRWYDELVYAVLASEWAGGVNRPR